MIRIGNGFDVHQFSIERKLILGGVEIPSEAGLLGHSDADVLIHAVMDALLGALALGDIGKWFPDSNNEYKDADSIKLLETIITSSDFSGWEIVNIDTTIIAQTPKLSTYIESMRQNIADACRSSKQQISVKATTTERLGFCGRKEGIAAMASVLLKEKTNA